jgi:group II intron reverse transcriptase/maturase
VSIKIPKILNTISKQNQKFKDWKNKRLYSILTIEEIYILAYEKIKSKPGNMTEGVDGKTIDSFSIEKVRKIIKKIKSEKYKFKPVRRVYIPKNNGKSRSLGIPSIEDKILQEAMRMILEAIYDGGKEGIFKNTSHGFRPNKSCHTALLEIQKKWTGIKWVIEGDIKSYFDNIDHSILIKILRKKIKDEKFIKLIWKLLKAGYIEEKKLYNTITGTPQGGIISPIIANIYLHELDIKLDEIIEKYTKGKGRRYNSAYRHLQYRKSKLFKLYNITKNKEILKLAKDIKNEMQKIPSKNPTDQNYIRIRYIRYADDWIVGIIGSKKLAKSIMDEIAEFLQNELKLTLNSEKTKITNIRERSITFLGTRIKTNYAVKRIKRIKKSIKLRSMIKRTACGAINILTPITELIKKLKSKGYCKGNGYPICNSKMINYTVPDIIKQYSSVNRGIQNYYRFTDNFYKVSKIQYIMQFSLAKTLGAKFKTSVKNIFKKYGKQLTYYYENYFKEKKKSVFWLNHNWKKIKIYCNQYNTDNSLETYCNDYSNSWLKSKKCSVCGKIGNTEMHHLKHIKKMNQNVKGFSKIMVCLNRKQIPVCWNCHYNIHQGNYNGKKLSDLSLLQN